MRTRGVSWAIDLPGSEWMGGERGRERGGRGEIKRIFVYYTYRRAERLTRCEVWQLTCCACIKHQIKFYYLSRALL